MFNYMMGGGSTAGRRIDFFYLKDYSTVISSSFLYIFYGKKIIYDQINETYSEELSNKVYRMNLSTGKLIETPIFEDLYLSNNRINATSVSENIYIYTINGRDALNDSLMHVDTDRQLITYDVTTNTSSEYQLPNAGFSLTGWEYRENCTAHVKEKIIYQIGNGFIDSLNLNNITHQNIIIDNFQKHSSVVFNDKIIIYGGTLGNDCTPSDRFYIYDTINNEIMNLNINKYFNIFNISAKYDCGMWLDNDWLYIYGGMTSDASCNNKIYYSDTLKIYAPTIGTPQRIIKKENEVNANIYPYSCDYNPITRKTIITGLEFDPFSTDMDDFDLTFGIINNGVRTLSSYILSNKNVSLPDFVFKVYSEFNINIKFHSTALLGRDIYLSNGIVYDGIIEEANGGIYKFNLDSKTLSFVNSKDNYYNSISFAYNDEIYFLGGRDINNISNTTLSKFNPSTNLFTDLLVLDNPGEIYETSYDNSLYGHDYILKDNNLYIYGGANENVNNFFNKLARINLLNLTDREEIPLSNVPKKLAYHTMQYYDVENKIYIIGGTEKASGAETYSNKIYSIDLNNNAFYQENESLNYNLNYIKSVIVNDKIYIHGGIKDNDEIINSLFIFDLSLGLGNRLSNNLYIDSPYLYGHSIIHDIIQDKLLFIGGESDQTSKYIYEHQIDSIEFIRIINDIEIISNQIGITVPITDTNPLIFYNGLLYGNDYTNIIFNINKIIIDFNGQTVYPGEHIEIITENTPNLIRTFEEYKSDGIQTTYNIQTTDSDIDVYQNGILLYKDREYIISGNDIILNEVNLDDDINFIHYQMTSITKNKLQFISDGSSIITINFSNIIDIDIYVNGLKLKKDVEFNISYSNDYSQTFINFNNNLNEGDEITYIFFS